MQTPDGLDLVTNSRIATFRECHRKEYWSYRHGIRKARVAVPLRVGGSFHDGRDHWAKYGEDDDAVEYGVRGYAKYPRWCVSAGDRYDWLTERQLVIEMLYGYFDH